MSLAQVLQLDDEHLWHMKALVAATPRRAARGAHVETVPASTRTLMATLPHPAFVEGRYFDVLAANTTAAVLSPRLAVGRNQLLDVFLDPAEKALHADWDGTTTCYVSSLRRTMGADVDDGRYVELVGRLSVASPRFRDLWNRHDVGVQHGTPVRFDHPQVGGLALHRERLDLAGTDGITLVVYHAAPHSDDADKVALLASSRLPAVDGAGPDRRSPASRRAGLAP